MKADLEKKMAEHIEKARQAVKLIDITPTMSDKQKQQIKSMNDRLLRAAEMRAKAVFKENLLQQMIASKQRKLSAMGENRAQRKRLDHLKYALGGQLVSYQYLEQAFVKCLLLNARNMAEYNKLRSEIIEFFPKALAEREYLQTEINTEPRFMLEKKKHAPTEKVE